MLALALSPSLSSRVVLSQTPLLPPDVDLTPLKETSPSKPAGKKDKDGKGGGKKGNESKGGKGSKGDSSAEQSSGVFSRTAWPLCATLSSLVDVIATGDMPQVSRRVPRKVGCAVQLGLRPIEITWLPDELRHPVVGAVEAAGLAQDRNDLVLF